MELKDLETMIYDLLKIAKEDGKITNNEKSMLRKVRDNLKRYVVEYEKSLADGRISKNEHKQLQKLHLKIYENSKHVAMGDGKINQDELNILLRLAKTILED